MKIKWDEIGSLICTECQWMGEKPIAFALDPEETVKGWVTYYWLGCPQCSSSTFDIITKQDLADTDFPKIGRLENDRH